MNYIKYAVAAVICLSALNCEAQKTEETSVETRQNIMKKSSIQKVELEEITRGSRKMVEKTASETTMLLNGKNSVTKNTVQNWNKVSALVADLNLEKINSYPSPTTDRFHDGALAATIKITAANGVVYKSQSFDSGKPPKELAALYAELASDFVGK